jgi:predicted XRE-type DNA-binding protein
MVALERLIARRGLTQARAAKLFGVSQPRVNDLVRGRFHRFSIDALVDMLARAGVRVRLTTERRAHVA